MQMDFCVRSGRALVLLLVHGGVFGVSLQFLGAHLPLCLPGDRSGYHDHVAVHGLFLRLDLHPGHRVPLSNGLSGRRRPADRLDQAPPALHELDNVLRRLPLPSAARLSLLVHRVQLDAALLPSGQDLPLLDVHGPHRASHQLPQRVPLPQFGPLPVGHIPLERFALPYRVEEQQFRP